MLCNKFCPTSENGYDCDKLSLCYGPTSSTFTVGPTVYTKITKIKCILNINSEQHNKNKRNVTILSKPRISCQNDFLYLIGCQVLGVLRN